MMYKKICLIFPCLIFLSASHLSFAEKTLVVGWKAMPPHQYIDKQGNLTGINIELITAILHTAGFQPEFREVPWQRGLKMLEKGDIDIVMSAFKSPERENYAYFSDTYFKLEYNCVFIRTTDREKYKSIQSLNDIIGTDFKIGVLRGGVFSKEYGELMKLPYFMKHIHEVNSSDQNIKKLLHKRVDGVITDELYGLWTLKQNNYTGKLSILFYLYGEKEAACYLMFSKKSMTENQTDIINRALKEIKSNGSYYDILNDYK